MSGTALTGCPGTRRRRGGARGIRPSGTAGRKTPCWLTALVPLIRQETANHRHDSTVLEDRPHFGVTSTLRRVAIPSVPEREGSVARGEVRSLRSWERSPN